MPGFKDFVNLATLLETDMDDLVMKQTVMKMASVAARTAALTGFFREGLVTYLDDLNTLGVNTAAADTWSTIGPVHGALTAWTPTVTQSGSVTVTVNYATYQRIGRVVHCWFKLTVTGSGTGANAVTLGGLPFSAQATVTDIALGTGRIYDSNVTTIHSAIMMLQSTTTLCFRSSAIASATGESRLGVVDFTAGLASGDVLDGSFAYEVGADA